MKTSIVQTRRIFDVLMPMILLSALGGCATSTPRGAGKAAVTRPLAEQINWPRDYAPDKAAFFVHNQIDISAPPEVVWNIIVRVEDWPEWYVGATNIVMGDSEKVLTSRSTIAWSLMGLDLESAVEEFVPPARLAWESRHPSIRGYHAWLLVPIEGGTRLISDESFHGVLAYMQGAFQPNKLHGLHQQQLEAIKAKAESRVRR
jgi:hypothetical protein